MNDVPHQQVELHAVAAALAIGKRLRLEALEIQTGLSRATIATTISALSDLGFPIEGTEATGYRVTQAVDLLNAPAIEAQLGTARDRIGSIEVFASIGSTSDHLMAISNPTQTLRVCLAEVQTAGRGRRGRGWASPFGSNLYLSMARQFESLAEISGLSIALGVAAAEALGRLGCSEVRLKWPNDLVWQGRKLGGLLVDIAGDPRRSCRVVAGIGVNVRMPSRSACHIDQPWCDLSQAGVTDVQRNALAAELIQAWADAFDQYQECGLYAFGQRFSALDACYGQLVQLQLSDHALNGVARGIAADGGLLLERNGALETHYAADVSLRLG